MSPESVESGISSCIRILPPLVAERIAAGEVIERPASVVKELIENCLDAGATEVAVALEDGGKSLIEVMDNGRGMGPEDLSLCIKRHATSKLRSLDDLEKISTLGFRGEALPSIGAAGELSILSRPSQPAGVAVHELVLPRHRPEPATFGHFLGCDHGTRIRVRNLFAQIPARLKFLKSQAAEVGHVREWMERLSLTHPHVGFKLTSDGRTVLSLRPQDEKARVRSILSDGDEYPVVEACCETEWGKLHAYWLQGLSSPQTRKLVQVVNKRAVRDRVLQQAMLAPFRQALLPGQFPAVVLLLEISPSLLDVNVHPTKTEIRFLESGKIFRAVENLISGMLAKDGASYAPAPQKAPWQQSNWQKPNWQAQEPSPPASSFSFVPETSQSSAPQKTLSFDLKPSIDASAAPQNTLAAEHAWLFRPERFSGCLFQTYLLYDLGEELGIIDQHAAHERIRFERLRARSLRPTEAAPPQSLLIPEAVHFSSDHRTRVEQRLGWLSQLGFEAEIFGDEALLFRSIPAEWGNEELRTRLKSLVERLLAYEGDRVPERLALDERLFESLASEACHSAVRAGQRLGATEATALVTELFHCEHPWNCPHGRPTVVRVARARFEEWFRRRI